MIKSDYIVKASQREDVYQKDRSEENLHALMLAYAYYNTAATSPQHSDREYYVQKACELFEQLHRERPTVEKYRKALEHIRIQKKLRPFLEE